MTVKDLKRGEYFTIKPIENPRGSQVYIRGDYDRETRRYCCGRFDDIGTSREFKGTQIIYIDFTF